MDVRPTETAVNGKKITGGMILTRKTEVLGEKHYTVWVVDG